MILIFKEFANGDNSTIEKLRNADDESEIKAILLLKKLNVILKEVDMPEAHHIRNAVEKYSETVETEMLKCFEEAYKEEDVDQMKVIPMFHS